MFLNRNFYNTKTSGASCVLLKKLRTERLRRLITPRTPQVNRPCVKSMSFIDSLNNVATSGYYVAKGIILYTLFYCTMNWWHYKRERKTLESSKRNNKNKDDDQK